MTITTDTINPDLTNWACPACGGTRSPDVSTEGCVVGVEWVLTCAECQRMDLAADYPDDEYLDDDLGWDGDHMDPVAADAQTLAMAGWGTEEDYGYFGDNEDWG